MARIIPVDENTFDREARIVVADAALGMTRISLQFKRWIFWSTVDYRYMSHHGSWGRTFAERADRQAQALIEEHLEALDEFEQRTRYLQGEGKGGENALA